MQSDIRQLMKAEQEIRDRLEEGADEMADMRRDMVVLSDRITNLNDTMMQYMAQNAELLDIYKGFKATVKVFGIIEHVCVFLVKVSAALAALWAFWKYVIIQTIQHGTKGP